jgi:hypothetical protein
MVILFRAAKATGLLTNRYYRDGCLLKSRINLVSILSVPWARMKAPLVFSVMSEYQAT